MKKNGLKTNVNLLDVDLFQEFLGHVKSLLNDISEQGLQDDIKQTIPLMNWIGQFVDEPNNETYSTKED